MELVNEIYKYKEEEDINLGLLRTAVRNLVLILSPFTPHICEELWEKLGNQESVYRTSWPSYDEAALVKDTVEIVIQINGKVKDKLNVANNLDKETFEKTALEDQKVQALLNGKELVKVIAVPNKLINLVVR
jgi:leucyl-tRNA synthetase